MGVRGLRLRPLNDGALKALDECRGCLPPQILLTMVREVPVESLALDVGCAVVGCFADWETLVVDSWFNSARVQCVLLSGNVKDNRRIRMSHSGRTFEWSDMDHSRLGGLTRCCLPFGFRRQGKGRIPPPHVPPLSERTSPARPLYGFLEPVVPGMEWRALDRTTSAASCAHHVVPSQVWTPHRAGCRHLPWPLHRIPDWVETWSVFFPGGSLQRKFTDKEWCQILDLRTDWGRLESTAMSPLESTNLVSHFRGWHSGRAVPIRLFVESLVGLAPVLLAHLGLLHPSDRIDENFSQRKKVEAQLDWGRHRPPWLALADDPDSIGSPLQNLTYLGWMWEPADTLNVTKAARSDDAAVDERLWSVGGMSPRFVTARRVLQAWLLRLFIRRFYLEAISWFNSLDPAARLRYQQRVGDAVRRAAESTWFGWDGGSCLIPWRWPTLWREEATFGFFGFTRKRCPPRLKFSMPPQDAETKAKDIEKLRKLIIRRYIVCGHVRTVIPRHNVPKETKDVIADDGSIVQLVVDIRVVWDMRTNGLNECMYTPRFILPTISSYLRRLEAGMYQGDFDIGECFNNFPLHPRFREDCGVIVPPELVSELRALGYDVAPFMRWARCPFGWQSAPYAAVRMMMRSVELAMGDLRDDPANPFAFSSVCLNLPGMADYDPSLPRIRLLRHDGLVAVILLMFVDDGRLAGPLSLIYKAIRQVIAHLQANGNQDAARKREAPEQRGRVWIGALCLADQGLVRVTVATKKWRKAQTFLAALPSVGSPFDRNAFRSGLGFLIHLGSVYDFISPYLKAFHLALQAWRPDRDSNGWLIDGEVGPSPDTESDMDLPAAAAYALSQDPDADISKLLRPDDEKAPTTLKVTDFLAESVRTLQLFFTGDSPIQQLAYPAQGLFSVAYGGLDASGEGYGARLRGEGLTPSLRYGFWSLGKALNSSNWREAQNCLESVQRDAQLGRLTGREVWIETDNMVLSRSFYKGYSSSPLLHSIIVDLRLVALRHNFLLRIVHVAGTRMIYTGVDGLSRGELQVGALHMPILEELPISLRPSHRSAALTPWVKSWLPDQAYVAEPMDWFIGAVQRGEHDASTMRTQLWIWDLCPAVALRCLEELGLGRLTRHEWLSGVVLIPQLLMHEWEGRFHKVIDFSFSLPAGACDCWPTDMHESLTIGCYLPLLRHEPWDWRNVPFMAGFQRSLSRMFKEGDPLAWDTLREFWLAADWIARMPKSLVRRLLLHDSWQRFLRVSRDRRNRQ